MKLSFEMRSRNGKRRTNKGEKEKHMKKQLSSGWPSSGRRTGTPSRWFLQRARACAACKPPRIHLHCYGIFHLFITATKIVFFPPCNNRKSWRRLEKSPTHMRRTRKRLTERPRAEIQPRNSSLEPSHPLTECSFAFKKWEIQKRPTSVCQNKSSADEG